MMLLNLHFAIGQPQEVMQDAKYEKEKANHFVFETPPGRKLSLLRIRLGEHLSSGDCSLHPVSYSSI